MTSDQRRYKRLNTNWVVRIRATRYTDTSVRRMREHIRNISVGGVYIETSVPLDVGTHIELVFAVPGRPGQVHTKGVVRWSNDGHNKDQPVGMGIEFLEVSTSEREAIQAYIANQGSKEILESLLQTPVHQNLLRLYCRKVGEQFDLDVLASFLSCPKSQLLEAVRDFARMQLVAFSNDTVAFLRPESGELSEAIQRWYQSAGSEPAS